VVVILSIIILYYLVILHISLAVPQFLVF